VQLAYRGSTYTQNQHLYQPQSTSKVILQSTSKVILQSTSKVILQSTSKVILQSTSKVILQSTSKVILQSTRIPTTECILNVSNLASRYVR
jgi:hypothetical protein